MEQPVDTLFPSIVFEAGGLLFSVDSQYISTIARVEGLQPLPDAPAAVLGVFPFWETLLTLLDLRSMLAMPSQEESYENFRQMMEDRKHDHINWVDQLERSALAGEPFPLATDPHQCALGRWCDRFRSPNQQVQAHLNRIQDPHERLHLAATPILSLAKDRDSPPDLIREKINGLRRDCMTQVISLLDETAEIFRDQVFHHMALVFRSSLSISLAVDAVLSVEHLTDVEEQSALDKLAHTPYIAKVQKSEKIAGTIFQLDPVKLCDGVGLSLADTMI